MDQDETAETIPLLSDLATDLATDLGGEKGRRGRRKRRGRRRRRRMRGRRASRGTWQPWTSSSTQSPGPRPTAGSPRSRFFWLLKVCKTEVTSRTTHSPHAFFPRPENSERWRNIYKTNETVILNHCPTVHFVSMQKLKTTLTSVDLESRLGSTEKKAKDQEEFDTAKDSQVSSQVSSQVRK